MDIYALRVCPDTSRTVNNVVVVCGQVKFMLNDKTTLSDLLSLNLHKYEDEVKNIVDKAVKEMSMEKVLKELNTTWTVMEFQHIKHPRTGTTMLQTSEEVIETLEDNQVREENTGLECKRQKQ